MDGVFKIRQLESPPGRDICIFEIEGSLQANTLQNFKDTVNPVINAGKKNVIFYCGKLVFASSAALGALMGVLDKVEVQGGKVVMVNLTEPVAEVFELLDFFDVFPVFKTVDEAIGYFG